MAKGSQYFSISFPPADSVCWLLYTSYRIATDYIVTSLRRWALLGNLRQRRGRTFSLPTGSHNAFPPTFLSVPIPYINLAPGRHSARLTKKKDASYSCDSGADTEAPDDYILGKQRPIVFICFQRITLKMIFHSQIRDEDYDSGVSGTSKRKQQNWDRLLGSNWNARKQNTSTGTQTTVLQCDGMKHVCTCCGV
jgi:hypothetical protein